MANYNPYPSGAPGDPLPPYYNHQTVDPTYAVPQQVVIHTPVQQQSQYTPGIDVPGQKWSWCPLVTSFISMFCCGVLGMVALVMSVLAYVDHSVKAFAKAKQKKNIALGLAIGSIVLGVVALTITLLLLYFLLGMFVAASSVTTASDVLNELDKTNVWWQAFDKVDNFRIFDGANATNRVTTDTPSIGEDYFKRMDDFHSDYWDR